MGGLRQIHPLSIAVGRKQIIGEFSSGKWIEKFLGLIESGAKFFDDVFWLIAHVDGAARDEWASVWDALIDPGIGLRDALAEIAPGRS